MKIRKRGYFFFFLFAFFLLKAEAVFAIDTLPEYAAYIFNFGVAIAGGLAVIVIMFGGVYYLISFGRGKFTNEGKEWVKAGLLGLFLTVCAYLIAYTINPNLIAFNLGELSEIPPFNLFPGKVPGIGAPIITYQEIPMGVLTEDLLSRKMDCYD